MKKRKRQKGRKANPRARKKNVNATPKEVDGITFKSTLEATCYLALKNAEIPATYEKQPLQLLDAFKDSSPLYKSHGNAPVREKTSNVKGVEYTPDFEDDLDSPHWGFFIEVKGRRNEAFPMRLKLFRRWRTIKGVNKDYFEVTNEKEIGEMIAIIKEQLNSM